MKKKIIIADDDAIVRTSLEQILNAKNYNVVATCANAKDAVTLYKAHQPDIILLDISMGEETGLDAAKQILAEDIKAKVLFITTFRADAYIEKAIAMGCSGYILKENIGGIVPAVDAVLSGQNVFGSQIISREAIQSDKVYKIHQLTERENDILILIANGFNNAEISEKLYLSEGTVRNYISNMLTKLALRDRTQLAIYYYKHM